MPAARETTTSQKEWMHACWEWAGELGAATGCALQVSLSPTRRAGVWGIRVRALEVVDGRPAGVRAQVAGEWPNAARVEFMPYVHALLMQLDAQLAADPLQATQPHP